MMEEGKLLWWEQLEHAVGKEKQRRRKRKIQAVNCKTAFPWSSSQTHNDPKTSMNRKGWKQNKRGVWCQTRINSKVLQKRGRQKLLLVVREKRLHLREGLLWRDDVDWERTFLGRRKEQHENLTDVFFRNSQPFLAMKVFQHRSE